MKKFTLLLLALALVLSVTPITVVAETEVHPMRYVQPGTLPPDYETGIAAVNEKLAADGVDIKVEIIRIPWGEYDTKLNLMLSSGEPFELLHVMQDVKNMSALAAMGAIVSVDPYLDKYPDLVGHVHRDRMARLPVQRRALRHSLLLALLRQHHVLHRPAHGRHEGCGL